MFNRLVIVCVIGAAMMASVMMASVTEARADVWGCSYEKCLAYCTKVGGKYCTTYCSNRLADKQKNRICK